MTDRPRRPGRPATGKTPTRSLRIGDAWDRARAIAEQRGETITAVIERALEDYIMSTTTVPPLSDGTRAAIANLVDYTIERQYGHDVTSVMAGARMIALGGLQFDLRDQFTAQAGTDEGLPGYAETTLRMLIRDGLATRVCQCRQIHPHGCPHHSAIGSIWCSSHYEADVPEIAGALLCGTCHIAEHQSRQ